MNYDVIIIGAGSAGCVLAARLSESTERSVLLLEAGLDYPEIDQMPREIKSDSNQTASQAGGAHNWSFDGTPNSRAGKNVPVARGKVVGGTSAINHQIFLRGLPGDFDRWASLGNDEWAYTKVLPYFRKSETDMDASGDFHGSSGPITVVRHKRENWLPLHEIFYRACVAAGYRDDLDMNSPDAEGVGAVPLNNHGGVRISTAMGYIDPCRHRLNLTVRPNVSVRRILFKGKRACGVEAMSGGQAFDISGSMVILSAGAIASPQLLMLSGVGPKKHLEELAIPVVHDSPGVGMNMKNHPGVTLRFRPVEGYSLQEDSPRNQVGLRFTAKGSKFQNDIQVQPLTSGPPGHVSDEIRVGCRLEYPTGASSLSLSAADHRVQPVLDYRFLDESSDCDRLREGVRECIRLFEDDSFSAVIHSRISPTPEEVASDDMLDHWIFANLGIAGHTSCTCKMGPESDPYAVVDQRCQVYGVDGLAVIDASVMPDIPRANTNATTIMIAGRAYDLLFENR